MYLDDLEILTVEEACEALKIGRNAIYRLLISGKHERLPQWLPLENPESCPVLVHSGERKN